MVFLTKWGSFTKGTSGAKLAGKKHPSPKEYWGKKRAIVLKRGRRFQTNKGE